MKPPLVLDPQMQAYLLGLDTQRKYSAHTVQNYALDLRQLVASCNSPVGFSGRTTTSIEPSLNEAATPDWRQVTENTIRRAVASLHAQGRAPRSLARMLSCWRGFFDHLALQGLVNSNPARDVRAPKAARLLPKALGTDQAVALMQHSHANEATDPTQSSAAQASIKIRDAAILELLYSSGLRLSELIGLDLTYTQRGDYQSLGRIDLQAHEATVMGKGGKTRTVPVGEHAVRALLAWLQVRATLAHADELALFVGSRGARISASVVQNLVRLAGQRAGLPVQMHPHMLRHSFASHVLQSSGDLRAVQELLGHANISTTQVYTQLDFQHLAKVYDAAHPRAKKTRP